MQRRRLENREISKEQLANRVRVHGLHSAWTRPSPPNPHLSEFWPALGEKGVKKSIAFERIRDTRTRDRRGGDCILLAHLNGCLSFGILFPWLIICSTPLVHDVAILNEKEGQKNCAYHATTTRSKKVKVATNFTSLEKSIYCIVTRISILIFNYLFDS